MIIYVLSPVRLETGGAELLHQLRYKLELMGYEAYMVYNGSDDSDPVPSAYRDKYRVKYVRNVDVTKGLFIVPEVMTEFCTLPQFSKAHTVIWWLSVDNAYAAKTKSF